MKAPFLPVITLLTGSWLSASELHQYDVVVYGGTSAGVIAAVQAKKMGKTAIIVGPDKHLGGLSSGGLGFTDTGDKSVIGGLSRDFYHRVWQYYQKPETWKWQKREEYGNKGQGTPAMDGENRTMWIFEPSIAEKVFEDYIREFNIPVHREEYLDREKGVHKEGARIKEITTLSGKKYQGRIFVDATYEGDLLASAKVDYHVGREANSTYDEEWNGIQTGVLHHRHHFGVLEKPIDPYVIPGDPNSGLLPRITAEKPGPYGTEDKGVQAYCFRMCLTDHPENRIPFPKPKNYDPKQYELLLRVYQAGWNETFRKFDPIPNHKTDTNNHGPFSTDNIGYNYDYPEASYERRKEIVEEHLNYQLGWLYFIATDPRIPKHVQEEMNRWGLPKDEFADNGNFSHQLYIREARRMIGNYVMTENELRKKKPTPESVGMGSYTIDSHNIQRYITPEGHVQNEGDIGVSLAGPYEIAYGSLIPKKEQADNLVVPICVSSTHIAFGSIRMEPVFMILAQSGVTAGVMAMDQNIALQDVDYEQLKAKLLQDGQVLHHEGSQLKLPKEGFVVDDLHAKYEGLWEESQANKPYVGAGYHHTGRDSKSLKKAIFGTQLPKAGKYEVRISFPANQNRASNAKVLVKTQDGIQTLKLNQRQAGDTTWGYQSLGEFELPRQAEVIFSNEGADGVVIADSVQFLEK